MSVTIPANSRTRRVLLAPPNVEGLIVDGLVRRFQYGKPPHDVPDMDDGRQGVPSLLTYTRPVVYAEATRSLSTMSSRRRGETPYAVALRGALLGDKSSSASSAMSRWAKTFDLP